MIGNGVSGGRASHDPSTGVGEATVEVVSTQADSTDKEKRTMKASTVGSGG